jgi:hypothetical protein
MSSKVTGPLTLASALAAAATAWLAGWLQTANVSRPVLAVGTAAVIAIAGRVFPALRPNLVAAGNDPVAIISTLALAAAGALVSWLGLSEQMQMLLVGALGLVSSGVVPSLRDTATGVLGRHAGP